MVESKEEIIKLLKKKLKYSRNRMNGIDFKIDGKNISSYGGRMIGYWEGYVSSIENLLDEIYGDDSWDKENAKD